MAMYKRIQKNPGEYAWGVQLDGPGAPGERVSVTRKDGRRIVETLGERVSYDGLQSVWTKATERTPARGTEVATGEAPPYLRGAVDDMAREAQREQEAEQAAAREARDRAYDMQRAAERRAEQEERRLAAERAEAQRVAGLERARQDQIAAAERALRTEREARERAAALEESQRALEAQRAAQRERDTRARAEAGAAPRMDGQIVAGAAAEGTGALVGWSGSGELSRSVILKVLTEAGLPESWAPRGKTAVAHAGKACSDLNLSGYIVRRVKLGAERGSGRRAWVARWVVRSNAATELGDGAPVILTVDLQADDSLVIEGPAQHLRERILGDYESLRRGEIYQAGDVTTWIASLLREHAGATRFGIGYYVPASGRSVASKLAAVMSARWGAGWIDPLLPVASSYELRVGVARGLSDDVAAVGKALASEREKAREAKRAEISPAVAARLLRDLGDVQERIGSYRALCGDSIIAPIVAQIGAIAGELSKLTDATSTRFSLLDMSEPVAEPVAVEAPTIAERAADRAVEARRSITPPSVPVIPVERVQAAPTPDAPPPAPKDDSDAATRFSLLELD